MSRLVLGLNTDHADSAAALVGEGGIIAAIAEERINRKKHCANFPVSAIQEVLRIAGASIEDVTDIAVARDPNANKFKKAIFVARRPGTAFKLARERLGVHRRVGSTLDRIAAELGSERSKVRADLHHVEHHLAHVASAFYWSPFDECAAFTHDGAGDFATSMWARCRGIDIEIGGRSYWPHSIGVFYTALTQFIGFTRYGEEYKVMGLSAYGKNAYADLMRRLVEYTPQRGLRLNLEYFRHHRSDGSFETIKDGSVTIPPLWSEKLEEHLGPVRKVGQDLATRDKDVAASMQIRFEDVFLKTVGSLVATTGLRDIVMAGGAALNSVANGRMITEGLVDRAYFQPAASDDGTAVGAASYVLHAKHRIQRASPVTHAFWGSEWPEKGIERALEINGRSFRRYPREELIQVAAGSIADGNIVGWFQGREEWGPRALGNRSILCNPALPTTKETLNSRVKNREPFRPFAPVCREEDLTTCFEGEHPVPFMIMVYKVRPDWRSRIPAVTHEDNTGRVQTVAPDQNANLYDLIGAFRARTGVPVLLNTSFNENEPIVHTPNQAIECFERTKMDALGIGPFWIEK